MQELQQKHTIPCYCLKIRRASAVITKFYDDSLRGCGVTSRQYSLLYQISRKELCSVRELSDAAQLDRSTLARSLKPLYQQALIADVRQPGTRNSRLKLTQAGEETLAQANRLWAGAQETVRQTLGGEGIAWLDRMLDLLGTL